MFGYQSLILNLFALLACLSSQSNVEHSAMPHTSYETVITTDHNQSPAVIELGLSLNDILDSSQNVKLPGANHFTRVQEPLLCSYESKLLYLQIGNAIDLELTSTSIIFPFHCFT